VSTGVPMGVMRTAKMYENFILELDWKHLRRGGNAGLFVYSDALTAPGVPFTRAIEVQILDGNSPDGVWTGHGDVFAIHGARFVPDQIGRASCRERVESWEGGSCLKQKRDAGVH